MDSKCDKMSIVLPTIRCCKKCRNRKIVVLYQNISRLKVKTRELDVLLFLRDHWLSNNKQNCINITDFMLVSAFCRSSSEHGGFGSYVKDDLDTKEVSCLTHVSEEKVF
jgi:hypothetical protein